MIFDDLILNEISKKALENYAKNPAQSLILSGKNGVGLFVIAKTLTQKIARKNLKIIKPLAHKNQKTENINIDDVREIRGLARSKRREKFFVIIDEAEKLTGAAPQAFLKILEEPPENLHFILTTHVPENLPKTIISRAEKIEILPPNFDFFEKIFDEFSREKLVENADFSRGQNAEKNAGNYENSEKNFARNFAKKPEKNLVKNAENFARKISENEKNQMKFLAKNSPAELARFLRDEAYFRAKVFAMENAKNFIAARNTSEKLAIIAEILNGKTAGENRNSAMNFVKNVANLSNFVFIKSAENSAKKLENLNEKNIENNKNFAQNLGKISEKISQNFAEKIDEKTREKIKMQNEIFAARAEILAQTLENLARNCNAKIQLLNLAVNF